MLRQSPQHQAQRAESAFWMLWSDGVRPSSSCSPGQQPPHQVQRGAPSGCRGPTACARPQAASPGSSRSTKCSVKLLLDVVVLATTSMVVVVVATTSMVVVVVAAMAIVVMAVVATTAMAVVVRVVVATAAVGSNRGYRSSRSRTRWPLPLGAPGSTMCSA